MIVLGLTGSIGMGKSTTAQLLRDIGIAVHDADDCVHQLYRGEAAPLIEAAFPGTVKDGVVDRQVLAQKVLGNTEALKKLERIIHPLVANSRNAFIAKNRAAGAKLVVLDVPLLFETGTDAETDTIIVASAPSAIQQERVLARPNMTLQRFEAILAKQVPDVEKRARADYIIDTSQGLEFARAQLQDIVHKILLKANHA